MEDTQISNQDHEQKIQTVLSAIENAKSKVGTEEYADACDEAKNYIGILEIRSLLIDKVKSIVNAIMKAGIKFDEDLLGGLLSRCRIYSLDIDCVKNIFNIMEDNIIFDNSILGYLLSACRGRSLDADCVKMVLEKKYKGYTFDKNSLPKFLDVCGENSLDGENLKNLYYACDKSVFEDDNKGEINCKLNSKTSKKFFQKLCEFHEIENEKKQNKKLEILGIVGITFGGLSGLAAIGLGAAVGIGALAVTIVAPIVAAVVGLALIGIFSYFVDKSRVNKVLNEIEEAKLNKEEVDVKKIPSDLRHRKKIQDALDESKAPLLQDAENEIVQ